MNKNFAHRKNIILTKDHSPLKAGSMGHITAWLDGVIGVMWYDVWSDSKEFIQEVKDNKGVYWSSYKPLEQGLNFLNEYTEVVDNDEEYKDLARRMGWKWDET